MSESTAASTVIDIEDVMIASGRDTEFVNTMNRLFEFNKRHFVLEAGCGTGKFGTSISTQFGPNVTLLDNDGTALERAARIKRCVIALKNVEIPVFAVKGDLLNLPYDDGTFHFVFNEGVIEHFRDPSIPLREMIRVSRDAVCAMVPNGLNQKQVEMARSQMAVFADRSDAWQHYEQPMTERDLRELFERVGLVDVFTTLIWADPRPPKSRADFRIAFAFGRKPKR